jgi:1,4-dihydroxy-2-naphthoate octaprenyltransferase
MRELAADYAALWGRTFRTLVRHLAGRPERALALFAEEAFPYLCGSRSALGVLRRGPREVELTVPGPTPVPPHYFAALAAAFVALSGSACEGRVEEGGRVRLSYTMGATHRMARAVQALATLRLPLLACAVFAWLTALVLTAQAVPAVPLPQSIAVLGGLLGAQMAANALHGLRNPRPAAFNPVQATRQALVAQAGLGLGLAAMATAWLVSLGHVAFLFWAGAGAVTAAGYAALRNAGLGPAFVAFTYGVLVPAGALSVLAPGYLATPLLVPFLFLPLGILAACLVFLDNIADRPLDEAGGQRTLAVRVPELHLPRTLGFWLLVAVALLAAQGFLFASYAGLLAAILAIPAALLVHEVRVHVDDPHRLAPVRLGMLALFVAGALLPVLLLAGGAG